MLDPLPPYAELLGLRTERGGERFHAGLDVHAPQGAPVRVVRAAAVTRSGPTTRDGVRAAPTPGTAG